MILEIPKNAETILHILEKAGYEAYVVGGCVRDSILGRSRMTGTSPHPQSRSRSRLCFTEQWIRACSMEQ